MVLSNLSNSLKDSLNKIKNSITCDRNLIEEVVKEIQKALLNSDVNVRLVLELTNKIRDRAIKENLDGLDKKEHLITIIYDEMTFFLGEGEKFELKKDIQNRILLVGLYGQGKTTTTAKLCNYFKVRGVRVCAIGVDTYRPAAFTQLKQLCDKIEVPVFGDENEKEKDPNKIYKKYENELKNFDLVIIDSAGRDSLANDLIDEIFSLNKVVSPTDTFLVMGADVGQIAQKQAEKFKEELDITGVIITKLDGTSKGGGALSACNVSKAPVRFIGVGEKINEFENFNSKNFVSELLGMGDIEGLLEKAKVALDEKSSQKLMEKFQKGEFDLEDLIGQMKSMKKIGSMTKILGMIPGFSNLNIDSSMLQGQEDKMKKWEYVLNSMTKNEKKNPKIINPSRISRISKGSGVDGKNINELLKQYKMMKKMSNMFSGQNNFDEKEMENLTKNMNNPNEMMKMAKKMGIGGKMLKGFMKRK